MTSFFRKMRISYQMLALFLVTGLVPMLLIAGIAYQNAADTLK